MGFLTQLRGSTTIEEELLSSVISISDAIDTAHDWEKLSEICDQLDEAFKLGDLTEEEADQLIADIKERAREVPEKAIERDKMHESRLKSPVRAPKTPLCATLTHSEKAGGQWKATERLSS